MSCARAGSSDGEAISTGVGSVLNPSEPIVVDVSFATGIATATVLSADSAISLERRSRRVHATIAVHVSGITAVAASRKSDAMHVPIATPSSGGRASLAASGHLSCAWAIHTMYAPTNAVQGYTVLCENGAMKKVSAIGDATSPISTASTAARVPASCFTDQPTISALAMKQAVGAISHSSRCSGSLAVSRPNHRGTHWPADASTVCPPLPVPTRVSGRRKAEATSGFHPSAVML